MSDNALEENLTGRAKVWGLDYWGWAAIFVLAMIAAGSAASLGLVPDRAAIWVRLAPLVLVAPMAHAQMKLFGRHGVSSPALTRYNRNMLLTFAAFGACLAAALYLGRTFGLNGAAAFGSAMLAVAPIFALVWTVARYLRDETDEFLRHKAIGALLFSLFFVLLVGAVWGSLQLFGLAPAVVNWWILPAWGVGLGLGNLWQWTRGR